jgi:Domain of unknown function (DUF4349)
MTSPKYVRTTGAVLAALGCLLVAGCSAGGHSTAASGSAESAPGAAAVAPRAPSGASAVHGGAALDSLPVASAGSIIYTASLTVRSAHLSQAAAQASQLARAAGGYVSGENASVNRAHPDQSTISLQLKIPVAGYARVLSTLSTRLGTRLSLAQHAQDVTETVADVSSRVTSARDAISQLRKLLARAGSVGSLLDVQNQINAEEASLESLLARQRALAHQTAFGTVSLLLVSKPVPAGKHKKAPGGFVAGLVAGWHGLVRVVSLLLTGAGAALPFAVILALAGYLAWRGRRWLRHRPRPAAAGPGGPGPAAAE